MEGNEGQFVPPFFCATLVPSDIDDHVAAHCVWVCTWFQSMCSFPLICLFPFAVTEPLAVYEWPGTSISLMHY